MIGVLRQLVRAGRYRLTLHARSEMDHKGVSTGELISALLAQACEIIEDYPDNSRGHSHLLVGWTPDGNPLHICCAVHEDCLVIITVYRPDETLWAEDWRTRR